MLSVKCLLRRCKHDRALRARLDRPESRRRDRADDCLSANAIANSARTRPARRDRLVAGGIANRALAATRSGQTRGPTRVDDRADRGGATTPACLRSGLDRPPDMWAWRSSPDRVRATVGRGCPALRGSCCFFIDTVSASRGRQPTPGTSSRTSPSSPSFGVSLSRRHPRRRRDHLPRPQSFWFVCCSNCCSNLLRLRAGLTQR